MTALDGPARVAARDVPRRGRRAPAPGAQLPPAAGASRLRRGGVGARRRGHRRTSTCWPATRRSTSATATPRWSRRRTPSSTGSRSPPARSTTTCSTRSPTGSPPCSRRCCRADLVLPMNTGAEAVETAVKAVRKWGYEVKGVPDDRATIVVATGNFHGRTTTIVSFSSDDDARRGFGPYTPGFRVVPYGDADALAAAVDETTVAVLLEPVQGEAGVVVPPAGLPGRGARGVRRAGALLVLDEVQSGLGRTGTTLACERAGVRPDLVTLGKALGGGIVPVSAVVGRGDVLGVLTPGHARLDVRRQPAGLRGRPRRHRPPSDRRAPGPGPRARRAPARAAGGDGRGRAAGRRARRRAVGRRGRRPDMGHRTRPVRARCSRVACWSRTPTARRCGSHRR